MIILHIALVLMIKHKNLEQVRVVNIAYISLCLCFITAHSLFMIRNGSIYNCLWFLLLSIGVLVIVDYKSGFWTLFVSFILFGAIVSTPFFVDINVLYYMNKQQMLITDSIVFWAVSTMSLYLLYNGWQMEKMKYLEKNELLAIKEKSELDKYHNLYLRAIDLFDNEKVYENPQFTMAELADMCETNINYLQKALKIYGKTENFSNFLNSYRINAFKAKVLYGEYEKFTISALFQSCGFTNQSTFNLTFKRFEGITPSEFIQMTKSKKKKVGGA
jgi:AraC-like DNA-binding protein